MNQQGNLKNNVIKIWKNFQWIDIIVAIIIAFIALVIAFMGVPKSLSPFKKLLIFISILVAALPLFIMNKKHNVRIYKLIYLALAYRFKERTFSKKKGNLDDLNVYQSIIDNEIVVAKGKLLRIVNFTPSNPWFKNEDDKNSYINTLVNYLDTKNNGINFLRIPKLSTYGENLNFLKENEKQKILNLKKNKASKEVIENFENYYIEKELDLDNLKTNLYINKYYVVIYSGDIDDLDMKTNSLLQKLEQIDAQPYVVKNNELLHLLASHNFKTITDEDIDRLYSQNAAEILEEIKSDEITEENEKKKERKYKRKQKELLKNRGFDLKDLLLPEEIIFKDDHFIMDGKYYAFQLVSDLPSQLALGWWSPLLDNNDNVNIIIYQNDEETTAKMLDKAMKHIEVNNLSEKSRYKKKKAELEQEFIDAIESELQMGSHIFYNLKFLILTKADSLEELDEKLANNYSQAKHDKITLNPLKYRQFEAFAQHQLFANFNLKDELQISSPNFVNGWAFASEGNNDGNGNLLALSADTSEPIIVNNFYTKSSQRTNYNAFIVGVTGKGKSTLVGKQVLNALSENNKVYILDLQNEYRNLAKKFGGTIIDFGAGIETVFNPLEIQVHLAEKDEKLIDTKTIINKHLEWLDGFFKLVDSNFEDYDILLINKALQDLYAKFNFYQTKNLDELKALKQPIISDLIQQLRHFEYEDDYAIERQKLRVWKIIDNLTFLFEANGKFKELYNGQTNIKLDDDFIVFNTQNLMTNTTNAAQSSLGTYVLLSFLQTKIYTNWLEKPHKWLMIVIEEAHHLLSANNPITSAFVFYTVKTARKFDTSIVLCTQNPGDITVDTRGKAILENCQYAYFLGLKNEDLKKIDQMFEYSGGLNESLKTYLNDASVGHGIVSLHSKSKIKMQLHYNDFEQEILFKKGNLGQNNNYLETTNE